MNRPAALKLTGIAAAMLAASAQAQTVDREVADSTHLDANALGAGLAYSASDGPRFGEYNGINQKGGYGILDFNVVTRNDETGTWSRMFGRNLGLGDPQLRAEQLKQGDWGYTIDYSRIPRYEPLTPLTAVTGIGTNNLTVPTTLTAGSPLPISTSRNALGLGVEKFIHGNWNVQLSFKNEEKEGARIFGRGTTSAGPPGTFGQFEFTPEPISSTTRQLEAKLNYVDTKLQMTGGYYGTLYNNQYGSSGLNINGGLAALASFNPIALPPDNQSHQLYLTGGYGFTSTTRGTFKVSYSKQIQDDQFVNVPVLAGIGSNLQGRVDTTLLQAGVTSHPMPKLTLLADIRWQDRDDKTPQFQYGSPGATTDGTNDVRSTKTTNAKVEASYMLPDSFRLTGGIAWDQIWRNTAPIRIVSYRETTDELSYRLELRRMMSETLTGALSYVHSDRTGSPFQTTIQNPAVSPGVGSNLIAPINLADRTRDKVRLSTTWTPTEPLSVQFFVDNAWDSYDSRDGDGLGPRKGTYQNYSIDAAYTFSEKLSANAWYSYNTTSMDQATCESATANGVCPGDAGNPIWAAALRSYSNNFGAGLHGKPHALVDVGADMTYSQIRDKYSQTTLVGGAVSSLPDITTTLTRINVYAKYALEKNSGIRVDYVYDRFSTDDWTWATWTYADGTQLVENPIQRVNFFMVSYYTRWR